jgi:hypothetical protein
VDPPSEDVKLQRAVETIWHLITDRRVVFVLGAGASLHEADAEQAGGPGRLPTAAELARELAQITNQELEQGVSPDLIQTSTYFELLATIVMGRAKSTGSWHPVPTSR